MCKAILLYLLFMGCLTSQISFASDVGSVRFDGVDILDDLLLIRTPYYSVLYSDSAKHPVLTIHRPMVCPVDSVVHSRAFSFVSSKLLPKPRPFSRLYTRSGFARGHLVPANSLACSYVAKRSTFAMWNVCPMLQTFNGGIWKQIENRSEAMARDSVNAIIVTGVANYRCGSCHFAKVGKMIAVPHAFFKVVWCTVHHHVIFSALVKQCNHFPAVGNMVCSNDSVIKSALIWINPEVLETITR